MPHPLKITVLSLITLGLSASRASAEDFKWGGQVTVSILGGETGNSQHLDGKPGLGLGVHAWLHLKDGHALVPRFDAIVYRNASPDANHWASGAELKKPSAAACLRPYELQARGSRRQRGLRFEQTGPGRGGRLSVQSPSWFELRDLDATFEPNDVSLSAPSLNASLMLRF